MISNSISQGPEVVRLNGEQTTPSQHTNRTGTPILSIGNPGETLQPDLPSSDPVISRGIVRPYRHSHTAPHSAFRTPKSPEPEFIVAGKEVVVKEILELLGCDINDPLAHARNQLKEESGK